ncbi:MAG: BamA/TamA family outer membrane protein [Bacteroidales bacterium]
MKKIFNTYTFVVFIALIALFASSCSVKRHIDESQYLLVKNKVEIEDAEVKTSELKRYIRQTPNRKILGFLRFHLGVYLMADRGKENRFKRWMKNTIGEAPVIYDPVLTQNTLNQFELYMQSKGYFNARVWYEENEVTESKMKVNYYIVGNEPYTIRDFEYTIEDPFLGGFVKEDTVNSLINRNENYDADVFQKERERISRKLRNEGFFEFNRDFITYRADTTVGQKQVDVNILFSNPVVPVSGYRDSVVEKRHRRFFISEVNIFPEYSALRGDHPYSDTTTVSTDENGDNYYFFHDNPLRIRPKVITRNIVFKPGDKYSVRSVERTYTYLTGLRNFRYVNVNFKESEKKYDNINPSDTIGLLDARIQLSRSPSVAYSIEAEGLNTAGNLGFGANLLLQNRNIFRGAEIFNFRIKGALEMVGDSEGAPVFESLPFNTFETGAEASIEFPKLLLPIAEGRLSQRARPKSMIMTGINYRQRPDYTRYVFNVNYGFEWSETKIKRHYVTPIEISTIRIFNDSILRDNIPDSNPLILSRFRNHLTAGLRYTYEYNTQKPGKSIDFVYLRTNFETSGNVLYLASEALNLSKDNLGHYRIFNIPYAQFVKGDADYRYYRYLGKKQALVFRAMAGIGVPYLNADVLPFVKSYYSGGANSIRAWRIYSLGPGSYRGESEASFDRYGDIKLEGNVEYRFPIYSFFHGAFFVDAGNVWFVQENPDFEGGEFLFDKFYDDIAIGGGFGIRLDFDFFIFRFDIGLPLRDPAKSPGERWDIQISSYRDFNYNLGIGYPF